MVKYINSIALMIIFFVSCDAHMQKGLELYQTRYEPEAEDKSIPDEFFTEEDNIDKAFPPGKEISTSTATDNSSLPESPDSITKTDSTKSKKVLTTLYNVSLGDTSRGTIVDFRGDGELGDVRIFKNEEKKRITLVLPSVNSNFKKKILNGAGDPLERVQVTAKNGSLNVSMNVADPSALDCKIERKAYGFQVVFLSEE